ncbi:MAG: 3-deoxy-manno-octulosonate cytidylyltransferase [Phycisphaerae bacterium]|nr:3-deoxy-manno-octulosonate cytidylyltransferase [Phycisphaerae bacterium]
MNAVVLIPARYAAQRLPGKPLLRETGRPLLQHVVEQAQKARLVARIIVATDDERIAAAVQSFGGDVEMTRADHVSGTDRVAEVASRIDAGLFINLQGDEAEMNPENIDRLVQLMRDRPDCRIGTVACRFPSDRPASGPGSPLDPNGVKVVIDRNGRALYFSRALIPFPRELARANMLDALPIGDYLLHLGLYGFRRETLRELGGLAPTPAERAECLEQLRWLENGYDIHVAIGDRPSQGIDTPEDYAAFVARWRAQHGTRTT